MQSSKALRMATQSLVRQMRNIAPAPARPGSSLQQYQAQRASKSLILKTLQPTKVNQQTQPMNHKLPMRQPPAVPQQPMMTQPPTEVS